MRDSPRLCFLTSRASSVANKVLGKRIKIFVLEIEAQNSVECSGEVCFLPFAPPLGALTLPPPQPCLKAMTRSPVTQNPAPRGQLTGPSCTLPVCSPDASPAQPPRRGAARPTWATSLDKATCTCPATAEEVLGREFQSAQGSGKGHAPPSLPKAALSGVRAAQNSSPASTSAGQQQGQGAAPRDPTSAGKLRISFDTQSQLCALGGSPSAPGISPDVGLELHQIDLERARKQRNTIRVQLSRPLE